MPCVRGCLADPDAVCARCGAAEGIQLEDARTEYAQPEPDFFDHLIGEPPPDPNAPVPLCRACAEEHHEFWDAMWQDYYEGRL
jgi:hypothetical protein